MSDWLRSNTIGLVALFVALGGTAIAVTAPKNSVTSKSIKKGAVKSVDVKDDTLTGSDILESSLQVPPSDPLPAALPAGKTVRGVFAVNYKADGASETHISNVSFGFTFPSALTPHYVAIGGAAPGACPGNATNPQAEPGHLCLYETSQANRTIPVITDENFNPNTTARWGALIVTSSTGAGLGGSTGSWAATAA
jgi:hypothetical protein